MGTGLRKWSFSRPRRRVTTSPASSSTLRCFITPKRVIGKRSSNVPRVWPSCRNSSSSKLRRVGSARALKTSSTSTLYVTLWSHVNPSSRFRSVEATETTRSALLRLCPRGLCSRAGEVLMAIRSCHVSDVYEPRRWRPRASFDLLEKEVAQSNSGRQRDLSVKSDLRMIGPSSHRRSRLSTSLLLMSTAQSRFILRRFSVVRKTGSYWLRLGPMGPRYVHSKCDQPYRHRIGSNPLHAPLPNAKVMSSSKTDRRQQR